MKTMVKNDKYLTNSGNMHKKTKKNLCNCDKITKNG